jgi:hypothetical protein
LLAADPYYARVRGEVGRALTKLARALRGSHGKTAPCIHQLFRIRQ